MVDGEQVAGRWFVDPVGKHEYRWHDGAAWTGWVTDGPRRHFDPIGSAPISGRSKAFKNRKHALNRLIGGLAAVAVGIALAAMSVTAESPGIVIVTAGPIIWGCVETVRAGRYLASKVQPSTVAPTEEPPQLDYDAEAGALEALVRAGKISTETCELAKIKLRRKYNLPAP